MKEPKILPWQAAATLFPAELVYRVTKATDRGGSAAGLLMVGASQVDDDWLRALNQMSNPRLKRKHVGALGYEDVAVPSHSEDE